MVPTAHSDPHNINIASKQTAAVGGDVINLLAYPAYTAGASYTDRARDRPKQ